MRKDNHMFHTTHEKGASWYNRYLESLFPSPDAPWRNLGTRMSRNIQELPASGENEVVKTSDHHQTLIIAVASTAGVTLVLAALLFLCFVKFCRNGSGGGRNDERPLLTLSMSDYSVASGNSITEESLVINSGLDKNASSLDEASLGVNSSSDSLDSSTTIKRQVSALPPPPGRSHLKPPSGRVASRAASRMASRVTSLRPEPPVSLKPHISLKAPQQPMPPSTVPSGGAPPPPPPPGPPAPRPPPPPMGSGPPPPPIPGGPAAPRPPPMLGAKGPRPPGARPPPGGPEGSNKTKLKPFFWDKVLANPEQQMVWHQIKAGSFQFNEEMIESLFGNANAEKNKNDRKKETSALEQRPQYLQIIDPKKAQNLSIMLRALNVTTEEVCDALLEGNELPAELIQTFLKMAPTQEEELKLRLYTGDLLQLGPADRFLKALVEIPFAFKRLEALLFMCTLSEEITSLKESFETLEVGSKELRNSRLFLKLLEAVLKTGNRMNDGTFRGGAQAFKLDTLLKLADVKGVDGKTTLLHFVVQEIIRSEGVRAGRTARESRSFSSVKTDDLLKEISAETEEHYRALGLEVVSRLSTELENVKKAAALDAENLTGTVAKLGHALSKTRDFMNTDMKNTEEEDNGFHETLESFIENAESDVKWVLEEEKRIMALVKSTGDYFHGNAAKDEGLRLFVIVRDFLIILDKVCKEVREKQKKVPKTLKKEPSSASTTSSADSHQQQTPNLRDPSLRDKLFPAIAERRMDDGGGFSSDEDSP